MTRRPQHWPLLLLSLSFPRVACTMAELGFDPATRVSPMPNAEPQDREPISLQAIEDLLQQPRFSVVLAANQPSLGVRVNVPGSATEPSSP